MDGIVDTQFVYGAGKWLLIFFAYVIRCLRPAISSIPVERMLGASVLSCITATIPTPDVNAT
jgi:hypothetical protein